MTKGTEKVINIYQETIDKINELGEYNIESFTKFLELFAPINSYYPAGFTIIPESVFKLHEDFTESVKSYTQTLRNLTTIAEVYDNMKLKTIDYLKTFITLLEKEKSGHS